MQLDTKVTNRILMLIALVMLVGGAIWCIFLNDAQRIIVAIGVALGIVNLLGLGYFFNKNMSKRR